MTEQAPVDPDEAIAALRHLVSPGWKPYTEPARQRGLDVRCWIDEVRVLLEQRDALKRALGDVVGACNYASCKSCFDAVGIAFAVIPELRTKP